MKTCFRWDGKEIVMTSGYTYRDRAVERLGKEGLGYQALIISFT
jgi:hypothetical protein